jgi:hypothetical protein
MASICAVIGSSCTALEEIRIESAALRGSDIVALSPLQHLASLSLAFYDARTFFEDEDSEIMLAEGLWQLGNSPNAVPFKRIELTRLSDDPIAFFASPRCEQLRELVLKSCEFPGDSLMTLLANAARSLTSISILFCDDLIERISHCTTLESLYVHVSSFDSGLEVLGSSWRPTSLRRVTLAGPVSEASIHALFPALEVVTYLDLDTSYVTEELVCDIFAHCTKLRSLHLHASKLASLATKLPPSIVDFQVTDEYHDIRHIPDDEILFEGYGDDDDDDDDEG